LINIQDWDKRNIWIDGSGDLVVREGMQRVFGAWGLDLEEFYGGFSVENPRTSEQIHYILGCSHEGDTFIYTVNEEFYPTARVFVGRKIRPAGPFQGGVLGNGQILCGAPGMQMYWGYVGCGLKPAERTNSALDVDFTTQTINDGLVASWQNRIVIGVRDALYFSDIGSPRAFLAANTTPAPGFIYFLKVSASGMLFMGTTNGMYSVAADSVYSGEIVQPVFQKVSEFPVNSFWQAAVTDKGPVALSSEGIVSAAAYGGEELLLGDRRITRTISQPVHFEDYKVGKIFSTPEGPIASFAAEMDHDNATWLLARVHERRGFFSWFEPAIQRRESDGEVVGDVAFSESFEIRAVLEDSDGTPYFLTDRSIFRFYGNVDTVADDPIGRFVVGTLAGSVLVDPQQNPVLRSVTTVSDNVGTLQYASIHGTEKKRSPDDFIKWVDPDSVTFLNETAIAFPICDLSLWKDAAAGTPGAEVDKYYTRRLKSIRHRFSLRTNDLSMEIGVEGSGFRIGLVSFQTKGAGQLRPQDGKDLDIKTLKVD